jgi:hypothetical protein
MIFATVGTQGQFDRLIRTVDEWAGAHGRADVFAQAGPSDYHSEHIRTERFIDPTEFRKRVEAASLVISHAGMGSIITALELGKRIIVMPRRRVWASTATTTNSQPQSGSPSKAALWLLSPNRSWSISWINSRSLTRPSGSAHKHRHTLSPPFAHL